MKKDLQSTTPICLSDSECWQILVDADIHELEIERRLMAGISLQEQVEEIENDYVSDTDGESLGV